jgi:hypothetical protein
MADTLILLSQKENIERAFKSLIKSGRPDITDDQNHSLIPSLYVDLYDDNYILNQVLDDNHVVLKGRKGTGKSTIFLQAENIIKQLDGKISIYINLQSCYEEIKTANSERDNEVLTRYKTYCNFFTQVLSSMKESIAKKFADEELDKLFIDIENGDYIDADFQRSLSISSTQNEEQSLGASISATSLKVAAEIKANVSTKSQTTMSQEVHELRVFSINKILRSLKDILHKHGVNKVYLLLDDFSELSKDNQKLIIDSLIAPIISSYNDVFTVKLAAYPYRIYLGNIDSSKIIIHSLDFYDVYEQSSQNYTQVEDYAIQYIRRTIEKRLEVFTNKQITMEEIFDEKISINDYLKTLFYASSGIPRSLGYVLTYCFLSTINQEKPITLVSINNAAKKYYRENILPDFYNDTRFKQSFYDDKSILDQITQKNLMDKLIEKAKSAKREIIIQYTKNRKDCKQIFIDTIEQKRTTNIYWIPTSHFYVEKDIESILQTLELYFVITKFNEGSSRVPGEKVSYFGLNYGLCLENLIDYGKPEFRRSYDYWRQDEFDLTHYIPSVLSNLEIPMCKSCGYKYDNEDEYQMCVKFNRCLKCGKENAVVKVNKFKERFEGKIQSWKKDSLPDLCIDILRLLYNYQGQSLSAFDIGSELDKHHLAITKSMTKLCHNNYVSFTRDDRRRYYKIEEAAISKFFTQDDRDNVALE